MPIVIEQLLLFVRYTVRRRWTVLAFAWLFCVVGWVTVLLLPSLYKSEARIYADTDILTPLVTGLGSEREAKNQIDALAETLLSRTNLEFVAAQVDLVTDPLRKESVVAALASTINIDSEGSNLFTISYSNRDPEKAHAVVASLLDTMLADELGTDRQGVGPAQAFIQGQLDIKSKELNEAQTLLSAFQKQNVDILAGQNEYLRNLDEAQQRADDLLADLNAAKVRRDQIQARIDRTPATISPSGLNSQGVADGSPEGQLRDLSQRLVELRNRLTDQHPDVIATERAIANLQTRIANGGPSRLPGVANPLRAELQGQLVEVETDIAGLENRLAQARDNERRLSARATELPEAQAELRRLQSNFDLIKRQYDDFQERRESARLVGDLGGRSDLIDFRVVDPANRPLQPASPARIALMLGVLIAGVAVGLATAVGSGIIQNPFESSRTIQELYGLQVLGSVSRIVSPNQLKAHRIWNFSYALGCVGLLVLFVIIVQAENGQMFALLRGDVVPGNTVQEVL